MTRPRIGLALVLIAAALAARPAAADGADVHGWLHAGTFAFDHAQYPQVGGRFAGLAPARPAVDVAVDALVVPAAIVAGDADLALPIALNDGVRLVPRAGVSGLLVGGGDFLGVASGVNAGAGLVFGANARRSVRLDYTARRFGNEDVSDDRVLHSVSIGFGW